MIVFLAVEEEQKREQECMDVQRVKIVGGPVTNTEGGDRGSVKNV